MPKEKKNAKKPNYSFDQWIKMTQELGDNVHSMVDKAKSDEKSIDDKEEAEKAEKDRLSKFKGLNKDNPLKGKKWDDYKKKKDDSKDGKPKDNEKTDNDLRK